MSHRACELARGRIRRTERYGISGLWQFHCGLMPANLISLPHFSVSPKAALAYEVLGREDDWRACLDDLIERHRRKYKLRPLLEGLRGA